MISGPFQRLRLYLGATEVLNMTISNIISLLTGIALFLFGMSMMGGGLNLAFRGADRTGRVVADPW